MLDFIDEFTGANGFAPSYREIAANLGYRSVATVAEHVRNLAEKGLLNKMDFKPRALKTLDKAPEKRSAEIRTGLVYGDFSAEIARLRDLERDEDAETLSRAAAILASLKSDD